MGEETDQAVESVNVEGSEEVEGESDLVENAENEAVAEDTAEEVETSVSMVAHEIKDTSSATEEVSMVAHEVNDTSEPGASIVAHVVQETEPETEPEDALDNEDASTKEAAVVQESDEESTPELEDAPGATGESGACSLEATCESPTDDLNSDRGSEEGGVSTDEGIVGSDEDDKEEKSDNLEKAKKPTEAEEKSEVISESS